MKITLLGQGYEAASENSVGNYLIKFLSRKDFHTFTGISAFASEAGVLGLSEYITNAKEAFKSLNLIVGIDYEGTSKEALLEINNLEINSYIFYQRESPIFHPKIYLSKKKSNINSIMEKNWLERFFEEEDRVFAELKEIDEFQRERGEFECRFIRKGFADRVAFYQIVGETPRKYILNWVLGESPYPDWGVEVKLPKKKVQQMILGRDSFENRIKERKGENA